MVKKILVVFAAIACLWGRAGFGQDFPVKPIRIIVGSGAGGSIDLTARMVTEGMTKFIGQPVIVENMPGSSGIIGNRALANAKPDGYTLMATSDVLFVTPIFFKDAGIDFIKGIDAVAMYAKDRLVLGAATGMPFKTFNEMIAYAKANPGKLRHATSGPGDMYIICMAAIAQKFGVDIENIAYKTAPAKMQAMLANEIQLNFSNPTGFGQLVESKKVVPLAVTGDKRVPVFPDAPTLQELGISGMNDNSHVILTLANTPAPILTKLSSTVGQVMKTPEAAARLSKLGMELVYFGPEQTKAYVADGIAHYGEVARKAGIQPQ
jgi:tripartite-type tricarboxylate transporter receptor subunit TctC